MLKKSSNHNTCHTYTYFFGKRYVIIVIIVILLVSVAISKKKYIQNVTHTAELGTLDAFINSKVKCLALYSFTQNNSKYYIWIGDSQSISRLLYSAPPAYVFDENGILIDFSLDFDTRPFSQRWYWKKSAKRLEKFPKIQIIHPRRDKPTGNHVQTTTDSAVETQTFNKANEIIAINNNSNAVSNDRSGNMTRISGIDLSYDAWNRLVRVTHNGLTVTQYQYNALNHRVIKTTPFETRYYYFNRNWQCLEEYANNSATPDITYVWGMRYIDDMICRIRSSETLYSITDANWNTVALANSSGNIVERYSYDAFGTLHIYDASFNERVASNYFWTRAFTGQVLDPDTGLMLYRNRYYSPSLGRFITRDPIGYRREKNLIRYIVNSPCNYLDYLGFEPIDFSYSGSLNNSPLNSDPIDITTTLEAGMQLHHWFPQSLKKEIHTLCSFITGFSIHLFTSMLEGWGINTPHYELHYVHYENYVEKVKQLLNENSTSCCDFLKAMKGLILEAHQKLGIPIPEIKFYNYNNKKPTGDMNLLDRIIKDFCDCKTENNPRTIYEPIRWSEFEKYLHKPYPTPPILILEPEPKPEYNQWKFPNINIPKIEIPPELLKLGGGVLIIGGAVYVATTFPVSGPVLGASAIVVLVVSQESLN